MAIPIYIPIYSDFVFDSYRKPNTPSLLKKLDYNCKGKDSREVKFSGFLFADL